MFTLLVPVIPMMAGVNDPGMIISLTPSHPMIPANASIPSNPNFLPEESPVVHCISEYKNITKDLFKPAASMH